MKVTGILEGLEIEGGTGCFVDRGDKSRCEKGYVDFPLLPVVWHVEVYLSRDVKKIEIRFSIIIPSDAGMVIGLDTSRVATLQNIGRDVWHSDERKES